MRILYHQHPYKNNETKNRRQSYPKNTRKTQKDGRQDRSLQRRKNMLIILLLSYHRKKKKTPLLSQSESQRNCLWCQSSRNGYFGNISDD